MARPCATNAKTTSLCDRFNMETGRKKESRKAQNNMAENSKKGEGRGRLEVLGRGSRPCEEQVKVDNKCGGLMRNIAPKGERDIILW